MNIKKKLVSLMAATSMLASLITAMPVLADSMIDQVYWEVENGPVNGYTGNNFVMTEPTVENGVMKMVAGNGVMLMLSQVPNIGTFNTSSKYTIEFDATATETIEGSRTLYVAPGGWWNQIELQASKVRTGDTWTDKTSLNQEWHYKVELSNTTITSTITDSTGATVSTGYRTNSSYAAFYNYCLRCESGAITIDNVTVSKDGEVLLTENFDYIRENPDWPKGVSYWSNGYVPGTNYTIQAESTDGFVKEGNYSLNFNSSSGEISDTQISVKIPLKKNLTIGKTYKVSYDMSRWARSSSWWNNFRVQFEGASGGETQVSSDLYNLDDCGWFSKSYDVTMTCDAKNIQFYTWSGDYSVDNLSVVEKFDDGTYGTYNYVYNGNFEMVEKDNYTELENVIAYSAMAANTATVSWTNPDIAVSDVAVKLDGEAVSATVDTAANAFNQVVLTDLTAGTTYAVEVSATINGETKTYNTQVTAAEERSYKIDNIDTLVSDKWATILSDGSFRDGNDGYANTVVSIEEENENSYVKFTGNIPTAPGNTYSGLQYTLESLDPYYAYKLVFKAKGENIENLHFMMSPITEGLEFAHVGDVNYISNEWETYEVWLDDYTDANSDLTSYDVNLQMISENYAGWYAIDDFEVYAYESDYTTEADGVNLVENSTFDVVEPVVVMADPVLTLNGATETTLKQGTMNVAVTVENVSDISLVLALYKDGALKTVSVMEKTTDGSSQLYETGLIVPDMSDGVYTAKVMYWNSLTGLVPLRGAFEITE